MRWVRVLLSTNGVRDEHRVLLMPGSGLSRWGVKQPRMGRIASAEDIRDTLWAALGTLPGEALT